MGNSPTQEPVFVLVVGDEPIVRALAADMLEDAGFEVVEAPTADYAATVLETRSDVGVVFTDVHMPGRMNGYGLARLIEDHHHRIGVVVTSGKAGPQPGELSPRASFIFKPYRTETLVRTVQNAVQVGRSRRL
jgi:two-component system, response regulator PdtaR